VAQTNVSLENGVTAIAGLSRRWIAVAIGSLVLLNFLALSTYQHYIAGDFPFQDEIGYVYRLFQLRDNGFDQYLFTAYGHYYMPTQLFIWYLFYKLTHLNIMAIRYTGAAVSALTALLFCTMLYRRAAARNWLTFSAIAVVPFVICSYNHWATYNQSIESVIEPLVLCLVLTLASFAQKTILAFSDRTNPGIPLVWTAGFVVLWLIAAGAGPTPIILPVAMLVAYILLERKVNVGLFLFGVFAVAAPAVYVIKGQGLHQEMAASPSALGNGLVGNSIEASVALVGNSLYSPHDVAGEKLTLIFGSLIILPLITYVVYALRLPREQRSPFFLPLTLTLFSAFVLVEILGARINSPNVGFTPRYSIVALTAVLSLIAWVVTAVNRSAWRALLGGCSLVVIAVAVAVADAQTVHALPLMKAALARDRETFVSLRGEPNPQQQRIMFINAPLLDDVYPDLLFLQQERLAMYAEADAPPIPPSQALQLLIVRHGPVIVRARTPFNVRPSGMSAMWLRLNRPVSGTISVVINGVRVHGFHRDDVVTLEVPPNLYRKAGAYPMYVIENDDGHSTRSDTVLFLVQ